MDSIRFSGRRGALAITVVAAVLALGLIVGVGLAMDQDGSVDDRIDPALQDASGEVEVVVTFEAPANGELATADDATATLKAQAAEHFAPLEAKAADSPDIEVRHTSWLGQSATVSIDTDAVALSSLADLPGVTSVDPPTTFELVETQTAQPTANETTTPSTTSQTWGLEWINAMDAWDDFDTKGEGVSVAVLDSGVDPDHPDLEVSKWQDFDGAPSSDPMDYGDHGTHVAGSVIGGDASGQHIGVAPEASLYMGAVLTQDDGNWGYHWQILDGMEWAIEQDADILSMSLGSADVAPSYIQAAENAFAAGTTVVAATGNDGIHTVSTPGDIYDVVSVGAMRSDGDVYYWSGGKEINTAEYWDGQAPDHWPDSYIAPDVSAPGVNVYSTLPGGDYGYKTGTSMATPHVAGTIALMQSATDVHLSPEQTMEIITETAIHPTDGGQDVDFGHGIIDAHAAVESAADTGVLDGTVTDAVTDSTLDEATVTAVADDGTEHVATTDAAGAYDLEYLPAGTYELTVERDGYETVVKEAIEVPGGDATSVPIQLTGDGAISMDLEGALFGDAIEDATLEASGHFGAYPVTSAEDGTYHIEDVPSVGTYEVDIQRDGYLDEQQDVTVSEAATAESSVTLTGDAGLELEVTDRVTDAPLADAHVAIEREDGVSVTLPEMTDADGHFAVAVPGADTSYGVGVGLEGYEDDGAVETVASGEVVDMPIQLAGDAKIEVTLTGERFGEAIVDATVTAAGEHGPYPATATGDGTYEIADVPSVGSYEVTTSASGYTDGTTSLSVTEAGPTDPVALELDGSASLSITVVDEDGEPIEAADLSVTTAANESIDLEPTGEDGIVSLSVPGTGESYTVTASAEGYIENTTTSEAVGDDATVDMSVTLDAESGSIPGFGVATAAIVAMALSIIAARRYR